MKWIEAWRLIDAYQLTPREYNLVQHSLNFGVSSMWAYISLKNDSTFMGPDCEEYSEKLLKYPALAILRVMDALIDATSYISKEEIVSRLNELMDALFDDSGLEGSRSAGFRGGLEWFANALYARKKYTEVDSSQLGKEYILVGHGIEQPCMSMEAYRFYDRMFRESLLIEKFKAIQMLYDWGYPLYIEVKGVSHALVERVVSGNAPKTDFEKALVNDNDEHSPTVPRCAGQENTESAMNSVNLLDTVTLAAWDGAIAAYETHHMKTANDALPRRMRILLRSLGGDSPAKLLKDNPGANISRDLKQAAG
jgi:hypothetical protein